MDRWISPPLRGTSQTHLSTITTQPAHSSCGMTSDQPSPLDASDVLRSHPPTTRQSQASKLISGSFRIPSLPPPDPKSPPCACMVPYRSKSSWTKAHRTGQRSCDHANLGLHTSRIRRGHVDDLRRERHGREEGRLGSCGGHGTRPLLWLGWYEMARGACTGGQSSSPRYVSQPSRRRMYLTNEPSSSHLNSQMANSTRHTSDLRGLSLLGSPPASLATLFALRSSLPDAGAKGRRRRLSE